MSLIKLQLYIFQRHIKCGKFGQSSQSLLFNGIYNPNVTTDLKCGYSYMRCDLSVNRHSISKT